MVEYQFLVESKHAVYLSTVNNSKERRLKKPDIVSRFYETIKSARINSTVLWDTNSKTIIPRIDTNKTY